MTTVSVHEAKTHLSRLIEQVLAGEEVVISRNKEPVVRIVREQPVRKRPLLGAMKGRLGNAGGAFLEPWTDEELGLDAWEKKGL